MNEPSNRETPDEKNNRARRDSNPVGIGYSSSALRPTLNSSVNKSTFSNTSPSNATSTLTAVPGVSAASASISSPSLVSTPPGSVLTSTASNSTGGLTFAKKLLASPSNSFTSLLNTINTPPVSSIAQHPQGVSPKPVTPVTPKNLSASSPQLQAPPLALTPTESHPTIVQSSDPSPNVSNNQTVTATIKEHRLRLHDSNYLSGDEILINPDYFKDIQVGDILVIAEAVIGAPGASPSRRPDHASSTIMSPVPTAPLTSFSPYTSKSQKNPSTVSSATVAPAPASVSPVPVPVHLNVRPSVSSKASTPPPHTSLSVQENQARFQKKSSKKITDSTKSSTGPEAVFATDLSTTPAHIGSPFLRRRSLSVKQQFKGADSASISNMAPNVPKNNITSTSLFVNKTSSSSIGQTHSLDALQTYEEPFKHARKNSFQTRSESQPKDSNANHSSAPQNNNTVPFSLNLFEVINDIRNIKPSALIIRVKTVPSAFQGSKTEISLLNTVADTFHLSAHSMVYVVKVAEESVALDHVELCFRDEYMSSSEMWSFKLRLSGDSVYLKKCVSVGTVRAQVNELVRKGKKVCSGVVTDETKVTFRSLSSNMHWLIHISSEMFHYTPDGRLCYELVLEFIERLIQKWANQNVNHILTVILFARVYRRSPNGQCIGSQTDSNGRPCNDYYKVLFDQKRTSECVQKPNDFLRTLKAEFLNFPRNIGLDITKLGSNINKVLNERFPHYIAHSSVSPSNSNSSLPSSDSAEEFLAHSIEGNTLSAINLCLSCLERFIMERSFPIQGRSITVLNAGKGLLKVTRNLSRITKRRMMDSGVSCDLISVASPPLHPSPLFVYGDSAPHFRKSELKHSVSVFEAKSGAEFSGEAKKKDHHDGSWPSPGKSWESILSPESRRSRGVAKRFAFPDHWLPIRFVNYQRTSNCIAYMGSSLEFENHVKQFIRSDIRIPFIRTYGRKEGGPISKPDQFKRHDDLVFRSTMYENVGSKLFLGEENAFENDDIVSPHKNASGHASGSSPRGTLKLLNAHHRRSASVFSSAADSGGPNLPSIPSRTTLRLKSTIDSDSLFSRDLISGETDGSTDNSKSPVLNTLGNSPATSVVSQVHSNSKQTGINPFRKNDMVQYIEKRRRTGNRRRWAHAINPSDSSTNFFKTQLQRANSLSDKDTSKTLGGSSGQDASSSRDTQIKKSRSDHLFDSPHKVDYSEKASERAREVDSTLQKSASATDVLDSGNSIHLDSIANPLNSNVAAFHGIYNDYNLSEEAMWKSLIMPALLPLTTDYIPEEGVLKRDEFYQYIHTLLLPFSKEGIFSDGVRTLLQQLVHQRIILDYQVVVGPSDELFVKNLASKDLYEKSLHKYSTPTTTPKRFRGNLSNTDSRNSSNSKEITRTSARATRCLLAKGRQYHELILRPESQSVEVKRYVQKDDKSRISNVLSHPYVYNMWSASEKRFHMKSMIFEHSPDRTNWNKLDGFLLNWINEETDIEEFAKRKRFVILPDIMIEDIFTTITNSSTLKNHDIMVTRTSSDSGKEKTTRSWKESFNKIGRFRDFLNSKKEKNLFMVQEDDVEVCLPWRLGGYIDPRLRKRHGPHQEMRASKVDMTSYKGQEGDWMLFKYDSLYSPEIAFHIEMHWIQCGGAIVDNFVNQCQRRLRTFGLSMIQVPFIFKSMNAGPFAILRQAGHLNSLGLRLSETYLRNKLHFYLDYTTLTELRYVHSSGGCLVVFRLDTRDGLREIKLGTRGKTIDSLRSVAGPNGGSARFVADSKDNRLEEKASCQNAHEPEVDDDEMWSVTWMNSELTRDDKSLDLNALCEEFFGFLNETLDDQSCCRALVENMIEELALAFN